MQATTRVKIPGPSWLTDALMELQYKFPVEAADPYEVVAERLGVTEEQLLEQLRKLKTLKLLKRVGFYVNYRAERKKAALIALSTSEPEAATRLLAGLLEVTHSYIRDHPVYNLWVVGKHQDPNMIIQAAKEAAEKHGDGRWLILWGVMTHRLSVKFDLHRGISLAGPYSTVNPNPPRPEDLGYDKTFARSLRVLPLEPHPYRVIGEKFGMTEDEVLEAVQKMFREGILGDPGAALDGHRLGFTYNAMYTLAPLEMERLRDLCKWVVENVPEATHIVERDATPKGAWRHLCYFMFHAVSPSLKTVVEERLKGCPLLESYLVIRSLGDMLPGVIR